MDLFDLQKKPPQWLLETHKTLIFLLIALSIICVAFGGLYFTAQWVRAETTIIPLLISVLGIPAIYVLVLKPIHYAFHHLPKK